MKPIDTRTPDERRHDRTLLLLSSAPYLLAVALLVALLRSLIG